MADRNADYMYNNGGVWDRMLFKTTASQVIGNCRSITFGRNSAQINAANTGSIIYNITAAERDSDTTLAKLVSGKIKILKTGRYLLNHQTEYLRHAGAALNGVREALVINGVFKFAYMGGGSWGEYCGGNGQMIRKLNAGDVLEISFSIDNGVWDITASAFFDLIYLGEVV